MIKIFSIVIFQLISSISFGQNTISKTDSTKVYSDKEVDKLPSFKGGINNYHNYLKQKTVRPFTDVNSPVSGLVVIGFVVDEQGKVTETKVLKSLNPEFDKAAVQVINKSSGYWIPAVKDGKNVPSRITAPIRF